jgi:RimJ/RimL family protein N-acetyltransferase
MRHDIEITGHAFRLRPIELNDAQSIVDLRTSQPERSQFLHPISADVSLQEAYLNKYFETPNDYYFVVERLKTGETEGLISIYDIEDRSGEWGRWILSNHSLASVESCWLIYKIGFDYLNLQDIYCRTISKNESVVSFHDACQIQRGNLLQKFFTLGAEKYDAVEHRINVEQWNSIRQVLESKSQQMAKRLNR